ncbi:cell adhesion molecule CEACAM5-like [Mytilus edulis]|uniref:cell adhesion molecule CEACAM5-like n=1 Tax=Mytilus edulis TaxID=6550 RepID=UPI0039EF8568
MNLFLVFSVYVLCVILVAGKPDPPKDVKINAIWKNANISWKISKNKWETTLIVLVDSEGNKVLFNYPYNHKYVRFPRTSYEIVNLTLCAEYVVTVEYRYNTNQWSDKTTQHFWMTNKTFTADINQNVTLSWTTSLTEFFNVHPPFNSTIIYNVHIGGTIILNYKGGKYIFEDNPKDVKAINITVIHVNKIDAGLYSAKDDSTGNVNGCCLLIVATKPIKPTLTIQPKHPFVGDNITFTCYSMAQRWPGNIPSHLLYQFVGKRKGDSNSNRLIMNNLTKLDKGTIISCQATDDLGKVSNMSNSVTLDPFYGPENVVVEPAIGNINVTEGTALGPIHCNASCYPECKYIWKQKMTGQFKPVTNEFISNNNRSVHVPTITRNQAGTYRCRVDHPVANGRTKRKDISVNVQSPPTKPTITLRPINPFVGDNISLTCKSTAQRWPGNIPAHLSYQFIGNKRGESNNNRLIMNNLTKLDKGTNITCQATDDLGEVSNMSKTVILDPYYGPENVVV